MAATFQARSFSYAFVPPGDQWLKFLKLHRLGLGVVLQTLANRLLVIPDSLGWAGAVEEQQVGRDDGIGGKDAVGQAHDGVQVEVLEQAVP